MCSKMRCLLLYNIHVHALQYVTQEFIIIVTDTVLCNCMIFVLEQFQSYINKVQIFYACILHDPQALKLYDYLRYMHCCSL